ncbi:DUF1810 domain-containing protein [Phyllobacterium brassicacearum]|uniref:DUF1810 domain-containing protein n=1 Tax=Phyllobacterium brassicacearum TaxID=314235 RepID=A0A2P7BK22_9HYPH|nr:DUF1810 domain-containing protein [Phyllobacterium brassicacearum]PSH66798.1 DUF1810 domain-containing protein [Phyllobacterium brassicacearum]TDQ32131.1 uncharacterized protein (DUF1810 family) [Phyllobacterium brassicacearum]
MSQGDSFDLQRFVVAQAPVFGDVLRELQGGRKQSHWMWFVFPQLRGLGHSALAEFYGIASLDEARAYLAHPLLGMRLDLCTRTVLHSEASSLHTIFGSPDDMKFKSCMTLFWVAAGNADDIFFQGLQCWCEGHLDERTLALISP